MKLKKILFTLTALTLISTPAWAANPKNYQVTGPVVEVTKDKIVVQKGRSNWEILRDASSGIPDNVKVGQRVTVDYVMVAKGFEVKEGKNKAKDGAKHNKGKDKEAATAH